jgi:hypothetical protein
VGRPVPGRAGPGPAPASACVSSAGTAPEASGQIHTILSLVSKTEATAYLHRDGVGKCQFGEHLLVKLARVLFRFFRRFLFRAVGVNFATLHHENYFFHNRDVGQGIAVDRNDVGKFSRIDAADIFIASGQFSAVDGSCA